MQWTSSKQQHPLFNCVQHQLLEGLCPVWLPSLILNGSASTASSASAAPLVMGEAPAAARPGLQGGSITLLCLHTELAGKAVAAGTRRDGSSPLLPSGGTHRLT